MTDPKCEADCRNCNLEDKPCNTCDEACLPCQEKFDEENQMTHRIDPAIVKANLVTTWNSAGMSPEVLSYSIDVVDALVREERRRIVALLKLGETDHVPTNNLVNGLITLIEETGK